ncbi:MAG: hypothetical protein H6909_02070 [Rickettsiaceae bacterium]|nr:hypothetical protein [Rickettsiaceae bacterium]
MSFAEIIVILVISVFCIKQQDIKEVLIKFRQFRKFTKEQQKKISSYLELDSDLKPNSIISDFGVDEINTYLAKILSMGHEYQGEYNIDEIKKYYDSIKKSHARIKKEQ